MMLEHGGLHQSGLQHISWPWSAKDGSQGACLHLELMVKVFVMARGDVKRRGGFRSKSLLL